MHTKFQLWQIILKVMGQHKLINLKETKLIVNILAILLGKNKGRALEALFQETLWLILDLNKKAKQGFLGMLLRNQ